MSTLPKTSLASHPSVRSMSKNLDAHQQESGGSDLLEGYEWIHQTQSNENLPATGSADFHESEVELHTLSMYQQVARGWQLGSGSSSSGSGLAGGDGGSGVGSGHQQVARGWQQGSGGSSSGRSLAGGE
eukprot:621477-Karenia_brevis.AAC.1